MMAGHPIEPQRRGLAGFDPAAPSDELPTVVLLLSCSGASNNFISRKIEPPTNSIQEESKQHEVCSNTDVRFSSN